MEAINAYLKKQMVFDNTVLEGISKFTRIEASYTVEHG